MYSIAIFVLVGFILKYFIIRIILWWRCSWWYLMCRIKKCQHIVELDYKMIAICKSESRTIVFYLQQNKNYFSIVFSVFFLYVYSIFRLGYRHFCLMPWPTNPKLIISASSIYVGCISQLYSHQMNVEKKLIGKWKRVFDIVTNSN